MLMDHRPRILHLIRDIKSVVWYVCGSKQCVDPIWWLMQINSINLTPSRIQDQDPSVESMLKGWKLKKRKKEKKIK